MNITLGVNTQNNTHKGLIESLIAQNIVDCGREVLLRYGSATIEDVAVLLDVRVETSGKGGREGELFHGRNRRPLDFKRTG